MPAMERRTILIKKNQMAASASLSTIETISNRLVSRGDLTNFLIELTSEARADSYMLLAVVHGEVKNEARIVFSNWVYDAIELTGRGVIAALAQGPLATVPGNPPAGLVTSQAPRARDIISGDEAVLLDVLGHTEIYSLSLNVGRQRFFLLLSSNRAGQINQAELMQVQLKCCYALCQAPELLVDAAAQDPLSVRERECLFWVSEGKTTDEVAVILGVSSNTVNSYITHAIQKFSASNRAMAIATAIRSGII